MVTRRISEDKSPRTRRPPATTPEARENQMVSLAVELAERQLREGTASAQVVTHFLKLGSSRDRLEQEKLRNENELTRAKIDSYANAEDMKALYADAMKAMSAYSGNEVQTDETDYDD